MVLTASSDDARRTRRHSSSNGTGFWHTTFIGTNWVVRGGACGDAEAGGDLPDPKALYPMAFLVEQDPDSETGAHFHTADQFQVVVGGSGRLGSHPLASVAVHYTNAYSPYGPIRAGSEGLHYFTLRNGWDPGARYMAQARAELRAVKRQHREAIADPEPSLPAAALAVSSAVSCAPVLAAEADGLGAWRYRVPPGETIQGPDPRTGGGQFWVVLTGALGHGGAALPPLSCLFVSPDEAPFTAIGGTEGLEVLALQFPTRAVQ
jgi:hypothetical protein